MPELPEVEAVRQALLPVMEGARFASVQLNRPDLRTPFPPDFAARLEGQTVRALERRGKYLIARLSSDDVLIMHLGMSGSFRVDVDGRREAPAARYFAHEATEPHDHVEFVMSSGARIVFNDPRRFGFMDVVSGDAMEARRGIGSLGPEPLSPAFDAAALAAACRGKKTSLKAALSDQRVVAGLGNIYVCEALHRAGLSPRRQAATIALKSGAPRDAAVRLAAAIRQVLHTALARPEEDRFRVYDREGQRCRTRGCTGVIRRITQSGRSTFYCPRCQR